MTLPQLATQRGPSDTFLHSKAIFGGQNGATVIKGCLVGGVEVGEKDSNKEWWYWRVCLQGLLFLFKDEMCSFSESLLYDEGGRGRGVIYIY